MRILRLISIYRVLIDSRHFFMQNGPAAFLYIPLGADTSSMAVCHSPNHFTCYPETLFNSYISLQLRGQIKSISKRTLVAH